MSDKVRRERAKHKSSNPRKEDGCAHTPTLAHTGSLLPDEVCLCCRQARREGEVELSDAAIRTTLSGRANKNEYFSPEISTGTYGGGLAHLQTRTHACRNTHTQRHSLTWLPEIVTSQSQMPQLSHQHRCVNDANCYAR